MPKKVRNLRCDECGTRKPDVRYVPDPFAQDVNDETWMRNLCSPCEQDRRDEI